jgi:hypothetical protein
VLGALLMACLAGLLAVALTSGGGGTPSRRPHDHPSVASHPSTSAPPKKAHKHAFPPAAAAAGRFVAVLQAGMASGQVSPDAGQNLFNQLSQLLFQPGGKNQQQQTQQRYDQLVQQYDRYRSDGQITGKSAAQLSYALSLLRRAIGAQ